MVKIMKNHWRKLVRNEGGQALAIVLVLLLLGSLITTSLLNYLGTGIRAGIIHEERSNGREKHD